MKKLQTNPSLLSFYTYWKAFCLILTNPDLNVGEEAIKSVGNVGVLPSSRGQVHIHLNHKASVGGDADMNLLLLSHTLCKEKTRQVGCLHVQCMQNSPKGPKLDIHGVCIMVCQTRNLEKAFTVAVINPQWMKGILIR